MGTFLKVLLIAFGIYFIGRALIRGLAVWLIGDVNKGIEDKLRQQQEEIARLRKKQEGEVTVNYRPKSNKSFAKEEGDYVDFEEVS